MSFRGGRFFFSDGRSNPGRTPWLAGVDLPPALVRVDRLQGHRLRGSIRTEDWLVEYHTIRAVCFVAVHMGCEPTRPDGSHSPPFLSCLGIIYVWRGGWK